MIPHDKIPENIQEAAIGIITDFAKKLHPLCKSFHVVASPLHDAGCGSCIFYNRGRGNGPCELRATSMLRKEPLWYMHTVFSITEREDAAAPDVYDRDTLIVTEMEFHDPAGLTLNGTQWNCECDAEKLWPHILESLQPQSKPVPKPAYMPEGQCVLF